MWKLYSMQSAVDSVKSTPGYSINGEVIEYYIYTASVA